MAEIFGRVESSETRNGNKVTTFRIPAISGKMATRRAKMNARLKGIKNYDVNEPEIVGDGDIPGQSIYDVTLVSER
jgi:hypothetical protein